MMIPSTTLQIPADTLFLYLNLNKVTEDIIVLVLRNVSSLFGPKMSNHPLVAKPPALNLPMYTFDNFVKQMHMITTLSK